MMEWFGAAALLPLLIGGAMCLIPMLLAVFGLRRAGEMSRRSDAPAGRCRGAPHDAASEGDPAGRPETVGVHR